MHVQNIINQWRMKKMNFQCESSILCIQNRNRKKKQINDQITLSLKRTNCWCQQNEFLTHCIDNEYTYTLCWTGH